MEGRPGAALVGALHVEGYGDRVAHPDHGVAVAADDARAGQADPEGAGDLLLAQAGGEALDLGAHLGGHVGRDRRTQGGLGEVTDALREPAEDGALLLEVVLGHLHDGVLDRHTPKGRTGSSGAGRRDGSALQAGNRCAVQPDPGREGDHRDQGQHDDEVEQQRPRTISR